MSGARVTDEVFFYGRKGKTDEAVRAVRNRNPDKLRWRRAVAALSQHAGSLEGRDRMMVEEPVREVLLDLDDQALQTEIILDARRFYVDLDRSEVLPSHRVGDLRRYSHILDTNLDWLSKYISLGSDFNAPIDTAGSVVVARSIANHFRMRAQRAWLELPDPDAHVQLSEQEKRIAQHGQACAEQHTRWQALSDRLLMAPDDNWIFDR